MEPSQKTMLPIAKLNLGFNDAENYQRKETKELFNRVFIRTEALEQLLRPHVSFLIGEKGTGKTAHAVYMANNPQPNNTWSTITYIREADYQKFVLLKQERHLTLTDYSNIWTVILYLLMAERLTRDEKSDLVMGSRKFQGLREAIDEYYAHSFSPEIIHAFSFAQEARHSAELIAMYSNILGEENGSLSFSDSRFHVNLRYIQRKFEEALSSLKLSRNHILFIDGIDIRPSSIPYEGYLDCVKGLADAIWRVNNDFFADIKDSKGRMRVVLLARPDIFNSLGLQNQNNKIRDNSVILDWRTTYAEYRNSMLFHLADRLLGSQQSAKMQRGQAWDYYFPYTGRNLDTGTEDPSFIEFLRLSLYRPRDIISMVSILQASFVNSNRDENDVFRERDVRDPNFVRQYSDYMLGEVKDQLSFYHSNEDYEIFLKFFEYLKGKNSFSYDEYVQAYLGFEAFIDRNSIRRPIFFETADTFLQFLYELNVICYKERIDDSDSYSSFIRWCFRERSFTNLSPKVKTHVRYSVHFGLGKALDLGKRFV